MIQIYMLQKIPLTVEVNMSFSRLLGFLPATSKSDYE